MSNSFWHHKMEGEQGDLLDIVRANVASSNIHDHHTTTTTSAFPSLPAQQRGGEDLGDPFSNLCVDPLLQNMQAGRTSSGVAQELLSEEMMNQPCNIFSQMLQISPPTTLGLNRRKNQAKKVVCIPAATAASSRHSGEVVPSDLWAWRKYGQKPIKGSPYPRAYYRCSSSKGCSARKQVERSRTDPNMLVITYTSEHKHPKPTQRNALAGSTRVQPPKNITSSPKSSPQDLIREEPPKETMSSISTSIVKEEVCEMEKAMPNLQTKDILADLTELDPEPISLIFSDEFIVECTDEERQNRNLDPFNMFNW